MIDIALTLNMKLASRWLASISVKTESETTSLYVLTNKTKANNLYVISNLFAIGNK